MLLGPPGGAGGGALLHAASKSIAAATPIIFIIIVEPPQPFRRDISSNGDRRLLVKRSIDSGKTAPRGAKARGIYRHILSKQGRPRRIGSIARGGDLALIGPGPVDRKQARRAAPAAPAGRRLAEIHQHPPVRRPGRTLDEKVLGEEALTRAV